jgi:hypothetical protein
MKPERERTSANQERGGRYNKVTTPDVCLAPLMKKKMIPPD